jgi:DNA-binding NtrC family response regulator
MRKLIVLGRPDLVAQELRLRARRRSGQRAFAAAGMMGSTENETLPPPQAKSAFASESPAFKWAAVNAGVRSDIPSIAPEHSNVAPISIERASRTVSYLDKVDEAGRTAETEVILNALHSVRWNRKRAAGMLNIDYKALLYKMKKLGIAEGATDWQSL